MGPVAGPVGRGDEGARVSVETVRAGSLGDRLAHVLRVAIVRGELAPGERLVEEGVARQYDVSRGPVRDALRVLAAEHLVESERRGYVVRGVGAADVDELYDVRSALEAVAVRAAAEHADEVDWSASEAALAGMREAADAGDWYTYAAHDLAFHSTLYAAVPNRRLRTLWEQIEPTFAVMLQETNKQDVDLHPSCADHERLLDAIRTPRLDEALAYLDEHLAGSRRRMKDALQQPRR